MDRWNIHRPRPQAPTWAVLLEAAHRLARMAGAADTQRLVHLIHLVFLTTMRTGSGDDRYLQEIRAFLEPYLQEIRAYLGLRPVVLQAFERYLERLRDGAR